MPTTDNSTNQCNQIPVIGAGVMMAVIHFIIAFFAGKHNADVLIYKRSVGALRESCDVLWTKGGHIMVFPVASWLFIVFNWYAWFVKVVS